MIVSRFRVAAIGLASWDELLVIDQFPQAGSYAIVRQVVEQSGGTTSNIAAALARLSVDVTLAAMVGDDAQGQRIRAELSAEGCDVRHVGTRQGEPTDRAVILVSGHGDGVDRTILWRQGARLRRGDFLPIEQLFAHDLVIVDVDDPQLRRFIVDLPMHVSPRTRLLGPLTYLTEVPPDAGLDLALRHDYVVGNERELRYITTAGDLDAAIARLQNAMVLSQTRFAVVSRGPEGCMIVGRVGTHAVPAFRVDVTDTTGAEDAFAAGVAFGILERWDPLRLGRFANAMGALAIRRLGARAALPNREEIAGFLASTETLGAAT